MNWFVEVLTRRYARFSGRAGRRECWHYLGLYMVVSLYFPVLDLIIGRFDHATGGGPLTRAFVLLTLLPTLALGSRRLHDTGRSAWWLLIAVVPLLGALVLLVFSLLRGAPAPNRFGPVPPSEA
jgi:uncharacterized membrane protein YhaH (DUF805 family)